MFSGKLASVPIAVTRLQLHQTCSRAASGAHTASAAVRARRCHRAVPAAALPPEGDTEERDHLAEPLVCACAFSVFGLTAFDVLGPSLHLLAPLDTAAQGFVASHWPVSAEARSIANAVSNTPIAVAVAAAAAAGVASGVHTPLRTLRRAALVASLYFAPGWGLTPKDVPLMDLLKHAFRRARPGFGLTHSATFSMPSGHTFAAFFWVSCAVLLASSRSSDGSTSGVADFIRRNQTALWALGGVTATGRLLSDVHWLSDTLAGGSLAVGVVSLAACILAGVETQSSTNGLAMQTFGTTNGADTKGPDQDSAAHPAEKAVESIQE